MENLGNFALVSFQGHCCLQLMTSVIRRGIADVEAEENITESTPRHEKCELE